MKRFLVAVSVIVVAAGCSSDKEITRLYQPGYIPGVQVSGNDLNTVRTGENVEVWYMGRYEDPSGMGMYEKATYYNLSKPSNWNLNPEEEYQGSAEENKIYDKVLIEVTALRQKKLQEELIRSQVDSKANEENIKDLRRKQSDVAAAAEALEAAKKKIEEKVGTIETQIGQLDSRDQQLLGKLEDRTKERDEFREKIGEVKKDQAERIAMLQEELKKCMATMNDMQKKQQELERQLMKEKSTETFNDEIQQKEEEPQKEENK